MAYTEKEQEAIIKEVMCPERVTLYCAKHFYSGPVKNNPEIKPAKNCKECWNVYFWHDIASAPPHLRAERLAELEEVLAKVAEMVEKGTFDLQPYDHAKIEFSEE